MSDIQSYENLTPPFYRIDRKENSITVNGPQSLTNWETVFALVKEHNLTQLKASEISDEAMSRLPQQLTALNSGGITDNGLLHLAKMPQLQKLDIGNWHSVITDRGLQVLKHLTNLRRFDMVWAQRISDAGLLNLENCQLLERVNVMGTRTGDGLLKAMVGKKNLAHLSAGNSVTDAGLAFLHDIPVFKTWQGGEIKFDLLSFDTEPNFLLMGGAITDKGLSSLAGLDGLVGLSFFGDQPRFTAKGLAALSALSKMAFFALDGNLCGDEAMESIGNLPQLRMLLAQGAIATEAGFAQLARSKTIEYIWGRETPNFNSQAFKSMSTMPALRGLALSLQLVDDEALSFLPRFPSLKQLMPMDVKDEAFRHIGRCEQLEAIWCMYCRETTDIATEQLAALKNLKFYYAGKTLITDRSLELLGKMGSLEKVSLWNIDGITNEGLAALAKLPRLASLQVDGCINITREGMPVFRPGVDVTYNT
jgi:hypothetical protein